MTLLTTLRAGAEEAIRTHHSTVTVSGLTVRFSKSNLLVAGFDVMKKDMHQIMTPGRSMECIGIHDIHIWIWKYTKRVIEHRIEILYSMSI